MRDDFVFILAYDKVFQVEWRGRLSLALTNLNIQPYVLIDFELKDLLLFLKRILALHMLDDT